MARLPCKISIFGSIVYLFMSKLQLSTEIIWGVLEHTYCIKYLFSKSMQLCMVCCTTTALVPIQI